MSVQMAASRADVPPVNARPTACAVDPFVRAMPQRVDATFPFCAGEPSRLAVPEIST